MARGAIQHDTDGALPGQTQQSNTDAFVIKLLENRAPADTTAPSANLYDPANGGSITFSALNGRAYIDVTFSDTGGSGLNSSTVTDSGQEFTLGGAAAAGVGINGSPTLVSGTTYRYSFTGSFGVGQVVVSFTAGSFADTAGNANLAGSEGFTVTEPAPQPPTNVGATDGVWTERVQVTWAVSTNATGYEVWRNTSNNSDTATNISSSDVTGTIYDDMTAVAGTRYWYWVKAKNASGPSGFSVSDRGCTRPWNDDFANRTRIYGASATVSGTNLGASKQSREPKHAGDSGGSSVWWTWKAPFSGRVQIDTFGSDFDTLLGVYTGSKVTSLKKVAMNDDSGDGSTSKVTFKAVRGKTYAIAVDGSGAASGNITLHVQRRKAIGGTLTALRTVSLDTNAEALADDSPTSAKRKDGPLTANFA